MTRGITIELDPPLTGLVLRLDERRLLGAAARAVAREHKKLLRRGVKPGGRPLRAPEDGGRPLRRSGSLIKSIRGRATRSRGRAIGQVLPTGQRADLGAKLRGRQAGLAAVLIHGKRSWTPRPREPGLFAMDPRLEGVARGAFERQLEKDLAGGRAAIVRGRLGASGLSGASSRLVGR